jgi:hypothetical protein
MPHNRKPHRGEAAHSAPGADDTLNGTMYKAVHERKRQPAPGAQSYSWETLALPAFTAIGAGNVAIRKRMHAWYYAPAYGFAGTVQIGLPYIAGQIISQPLIDPYTPVGTG